MHHPNVETKSPFSFFLEQNGKRKILNGSVISQHTAYKGNNINLNKNVIINFSTFLSC